MKWIQVKVENDVDKIKLTRLNGDTFTSTSKQLNEELGDFLHSPDPSPSTETRQPTYTIAQIRQAGKEGEVNHLDVEHIIDLLKEGSDKSTETGQQECEHWWRGDKSFGKRICSRCGQYEGEAAAAFQPQEVNADGQKEPLYRWVRASEPPKEDGDYVVKTTLYHFGDHIMVGLMRFKNGHWNEGDSKNVIEWLCKVETPKQDELWPEVKKLVEKGLRKSEEYNWETGDPGQVIMELENVLSKINTLIKK